MVAERTIRQTRYGWKIEDKYQNVILIFVISVFLCSALIPHLNKYEPEDRTEPKNPVSVASIVPTNQADVTVTYTIALD
jgi:hypothetical protein